MEVMGISLTGMAWARAVLLFSLGLLGALAPGGILHLFFGRQSCHGKMLPGAAHRHSGRSLMPVKSGGATKERAAPAQCTWGTWAFRRSSRQVKSSERSLERAAGAAERLRRLARANRGDARHLHFASTRIVLLGDTDTRTLLLRGNLWQAVTHRASPRR